MYRKEAIEYSRNRRLGQIIVYPKAGVWHLFVFLSLAFLAIVIGLFSFSYTDKLSTQGETVYNQGSTILVSQVSGTVVALHVSIGDAVTEGQVLGRIYSNTYSQGSQGPLGEIEGLEQTIIEKNQTMVDLLDRKYHGKNQALLQRIKALRKSQKEIDQLVINKKRQLAIKNKWYLVTKDLFQKGARSQAQLDAAENEYLEIHGELKNLQINKQNTAVEIADAQEELSALEYQKQREEKDLLSQNLAAKKAMVRTNRSKEHILRSPFTGIVDAIFVRKDQEVRAEERLLHIRKHESELTGSLRLSDRGRGFAKVGQKVELKYHSFAFQKIWCSQGRDYIDRRFD